MASGRMLNRRISKSKKIPQVSGKSRDIYFMTYPHLDVEGRYSGDPEDIQDDCVPKMNYSIKQIAESIVELADIGLIVLYENEEKKPFIEFTNFHKFQPGIRRDREAPSSIPSPKECQDYSGSTPALYLSLSLSLRKKVRKEVIYFDYEQRKFLNIKKEDKEGWKDAYPNCDIEIELKKMREWLLANPEKRKQNYRRFIVGWLVKTQDRGGTKKTSKDRDWVRKAREKK